MSRDACEQGCCQHGHGGVRSSPDPSVGSLHYERYERQQAERSEYRSDDEQEPVPGVAPVQHQPACRECAVHDRSALGDVPDREDGNRENQCQTGARIEPARDRGGDHDRGYELRRPEREERRAENGGDDAERDRHCAARMALCRGERLLVLRGAFLAGRATLRRPQCVPQLGGEVGRVRSRGGIDRERRVHGGDEAAREASALGRQRRSAGLDGVCDLLDGHSPEGMPVGERLPQEDSDRPDVALGRRVTAGEPLRGDVGQGSRHVPDRRERVGAVELRESEVEKADGELVAVLDEDVGGLYVTVDDPRAMSVCQRVEHLRRDRHGIAIGERARANRLPQSPPGHVLVGDVHMARVVPHVVRANTPFVTQAACCERLSLGPRRRLSFAGDDLERDVEAVPLVECEPDGAGASAPERAHGPIAAENELLGGWDSCDGRHR